MEKINFKDIPENYFIGLITKNGLKLLIKENKIKGGFSGYTCKEAFLDSKNTLLCKSVDEAKWTQESIRAYIHRFKQNENTSELVCIATKSEEAFKNWINGKD